MNFRRTIFFIVSVSVLAAILLSACGSATAPTTVPSAVASPTVVPPTLIPPTPLPPTEVPPTAVPPTAAPPTATPEPVTLTITKNGNTQLQLSDSALHAMPVVTLHLTLPKMDTADYTGVRLNDILNKAGFKPGDATVTFTASDGSTTRALLIDIPACIDCMVAFDPDTPGVYNLAMPGNPGLNFAHPWLKGLVSIGVSGYISLTVTGLVDSEQHLTEKGLRALFQVVTLNLVHPKNGAADYTGVRLNDLLNKAGIKTGASSVSFTTSDGFTNTLDLAIVKACTDCLVTFEPATPDIYNLAMPGQTSAESWVNNLVSIVVK